MQKIEELILAVADSVKELKPFQVVLEDSASQKRVKKSILPPEYVSKFNPVSNIYEVACLVKGRCIINIKGVSYRMQPGDFCFINIGDKHFESYIRKDTAYEMLWFICSTAFMLKVIHTSYSSKTGLKMLASVSMKVNRESMALLKEIMKSKTIRKEEEAVKKHLVKWFGLVKENMEKNKNVTRVFDQATVSDLLYKAKRLEKAVEFVKKNYRTRITLKEIAGQIGLTPLYFCALFKKVYGVTLFEYIIHLRLGEACNLLKKTDLTISEIGCRVGYQDSLFFSRIFKRYIGIPPKEYKKKNIQVPTSSTLVFDPNILTG